MYKMILVLLLAVAMSFIYAQKTEKDKIQPDNKSVAANIIETKSSETNNTSDVAVLETSKTGNPNLKASVKPTGKTKVKPKHKPTRRPHLKRRRQRRRKRPRPGRLRKPRPTQMSRQKRKLQRKPHPKSKGKSNESHTKQTETKKQTQSKTKDQDPQAEHITPDKKDLSTDLQVKQDSANKQNPNKVTDKQQFKANTIIKHETKEEKVTGGASETQVNPVKHEDLTQDKLSETTHLEVGNEPPTVVAMAQNQPEPIVKSKLKVIKNESPTMVKAMAQIQPEPIVKSKLKVIKNESTTESKTQKESKEKIKTNSKTDTGTQKEKSVTNVINSVKTKLDKKPKGPKVNKPSPTKTFNEKESRVNKEKPVKKVISSGKRKLDKKTKEQKVNKPAQENTFKDQDQFFDFFQEFVITTEQNLQPPPDFDPNKKPAKKVLPKVDPSKGIAYDGTPCSVNYKAHPKKKTKYMMRLPDDVWQARDCPPNLSKGLVWRQDLCNCGEELVPQDPDDFCGIQGYNPYPSNRHKYMRRHHGINNVMDCPANLVWSQKVCLCLFDPDAIKPIEPTVTFVCKTILNLTFESHLENTAEGYYVKPVAFGRRSKIPRIRFVKTLGADGLAAQIVSQPLQFQAFRGNDFQKQVTFSLNFKVTGRRKKSRNFMLLLTDECERTQSGINKQWEASISLSFQPVSRTFRLLFRTEETVVKEDIKGAKPDRYQWYKVVVYFEDGTVNLENNGKLLFTTDKVQGKIPPNRCPLYIAGRGKGYDKKQNFHGYMDNIFLVKDCKFHDSNIKIL